MAKNKESKKETKDPKKAKKQSAEQTKGKKSDVKKEPKGKAKSEKQEAKPVKEGAWDEQTMDGDFYKLPTGDNDCLLRIRSVISLGQCVFEFQGKKEDAAKSAIALVIEAWPYKVKKDKIKLTSDKPAIIHHTMKAIEGNKDSHWTAMKRELEAATPDKLANAVGLGVVKATKNDGKTYMYLQKRPFKAGLAERKAVPKLTGKSHVIPNLNEMTPEAMKELNPFTQVAKMMLGAINFPDSQAEKVVKKIRKDKPEFAIFESKKGKGKRQGKDAKKKKLSENKEY